MNRRAFLASLVTVPAAVATVTASRRPPYGHVTVENCLEKTGFHSSQAAVYLNGELVTGSGAKVLEANDVDGFIVRLRRNADGGYFSGVGSEYEILADGTGHVSLAKERVYGHVDIRERA